MLRAVRDSDSDQIIALVGACWAEYPGCVMDMDENPELLRLASYFAEAGGAFWVAEDQGQIVGMIGTRPSEEAWEICKVYVRASARGTGLANRLLAAAEAHARDQGATSLVLWSDTRFDRAHRFYERHSYVRQGGIRALDDLSNSLEFGYAKPLAGVVVKRLDAAAAASAAGGLGRILQDCVDSGASVSFLPPLDPGVAREFYRARATEVARGQRILLAAWVDGVLAGSVMLDIAMPQNQPHRAEVQKLLVHSAIRRRGAARALMAAIEAEAAAAGRGLLVLDTRAGDSAEQLYASTGWTESGRIPGFTRLIDGGFCDTVFFYRRTAAEGG